MTNRNLPKTLPEINAALQQVQNLTSVPVDELRQCTLQQLQKLDNEAGGLFMTVQDAIEQLPHLQREALRQTLPVDLGEQTFALWRLLADQLLVSFERFMQNLSVQMQGGISEDISEYRIMGIAGAHLQSSLTREAIGKVMTELCDGGSGGI